MSENRFLQKYQAKTNLELEKIAASRYDYVLDARSAAAQILRSRKVPSPHEASIEAEIKMRDHKEVKLKIDQEKQNQKIIEKLNTIQVGRTARRMLKNRNELQVKRWNHRWFQVRIDNNYRSSFAPVILCLITKRSELRMYPFLYMRTVLWLSIITSIVILFMLINGLSEQLMSFVLFQFCFFIGIQVLLMPLLFFIIKDAFKSKFGD